MPRPGPATLPRAGPRRVLITLCPTTTTSYGVLYYAFPVMATHISADTGWPTVATTAGFSGAQLIAALVGIPIGRHLDRHGPRAAMTAGSALAALATARRSPLHPRCRRSAPPGFRPVVATGRCLVPARLHRAHPLVAAPDACTRSTWS